MGTILKWIGYTILSILIVSTLVGGGLAILAVVSVLAIAVFLIGAVVCVTVLIKAWFDARKRR